MELVTEFSVLVDALTRGDEQKPCEEVEARGEVAPHAQRTSRHQTCFHNTCWAKKGILVRVVEPEDFLGFRLRLQQF